MALTKYVGGPCNGRLVLGEIGDDRVCGGVNYTLMDDGNYHPGSDGNEPVGVEAVGTHAPKGWHDLQLSVNRRLPTALQKARRMRSATKRTIARRRRVR